MLPARHDVAGAARGGATGVDGARRGTMMQAWQVFDLPVVSSFPRHTGLRPACRVLVPTPHRSSACLSCPRPHATQVFGLPVVSSSPRHIGLRPACRVLIPAPCRPLAGSPYVLQIPLTQVLFARPSCAAGLWRACCGDIVYLVLGAKIITAGAVTACCGN